MNQRPEKSLSTPSVAKFSLEKTPKRQTSEYTVNMDNRQKDNWFSTLSQPWWIYQGKIDNRLKKNEVVDL